MDFERISWLALLTAILLAFSARPCAAQPPAGSFGELQQRVHPGDQVQITTLDGHHTTGKLLGTTPTSLDLQPRGRWRWQKPPARSFAESDVTRVVRHDSEWNGGLIGFAAGFVPSFIAASNDSDPETRGWGVYASLTFFGPVGAIGGILVDRMFNARVYQRTDVSRTTLRVQPLLTDSGVGVSAQLRF